MTAGYMAMRSATGSRNLIKFPIEVVLFGTVDAGEY